MRTVASRHQLPASHVLYVSSNVRKWGRGRRLLSSPPVTDVAIDGPSKRSLGTENIEPCSFSETGQRER